jgi:predicted DNA-binding protein with PD1-like motif
MRAKVLSERPERTYALIFDTGDEVVSTLEAFAEENGLSAARLSAIGAFRQATLGYFDWQAKAYQRAEFDEQMEVLSLIGDIALCAAKPKLHAHVVLGRSDMSTRGGHLLAATVRPTLEVVLVESPQHLRRESDAASGLALIKIGT